MKIYLARHGDYVLDVSRQLDVLSEQGIEDIRQLANFIKPLNIHVSNIFHSGKFRAQQTAEILSGAIHCELPIELKSGLRPDDDVNLFVDELAHWNTDLFIVGHLPFLGCLVSKLIVGNESKNIINFQTGTIVCLEKIDTLTWVINWVLTPSILTL